MTISAKIIADSISDDGVRIATMQLRYPRFVHAEFMTHRVFSRNASSSRAIPVERLIQDIIDDTAMPIHWGKNQPGMQAKPESEPVTKVWHDGGYCMPGYWDEFDCNKKWSEARNNAIAMARAFNEAGYHKQIVNRLLEPFSHINVVVTATEWANFFGLRRHPDAQPEIRELADKMFDAMQASTPRLLEPGYWHLPYITADDWEWWKAEMCKRGLSGATYEALKSDIIKVSVARCARVSYLTHDGKKPDIYDDLKLYDRLVGAAPLHASPAEHQATPDIYLNMGWMERHLHGNFVGWVQYRKTLPNENIQ